MIEENKQMQMVKIQFFPVVCNVSIREVEREFVEKLVFLLFNLFQRGSRVNARLDVATFWHLTCFLGICSKY